MYHSLFNPSATFIYGDGDHARELAHICTSYASTQSRPDVAYLISKNQSILPYVDPEVYNIYHVIGVGVPSIRRQIHRTVGDDVRWALVAAHSSTSAEGVECDTGNVFMYNCTIALGVQLGKHVLINYNASVGHDATVGDYSVISPNSSIGGRCVLGEAVYIGAGANIREKTTIGDDAFIGMGAIVTKDVPPNAIVIGANEHYTREEWEARKNGSS